MRIRRRQAQFLLPAPPSDLPPNPSPPVQHLVPHPHENPPPHQPLAVVFPSPPPDQANQRLPSTAAGPDGWDWPGMKKKQRLKVGGYGDERCRDGEKSNDTRKGISGSGAETGYGVLPFSSSSGGEVVRWGEGEKAFPLKKRRGSFERGGVLLLSPPVVNQETIMEKEKRMKTKIMKTKMNKKCVVEKDQEEEEEEHGSEERETKQGSCSSTGASPAAPAPAVGAKKRSRGGALMEGSRCSRVNGRGWRCCQQTLVGYSLCEHHLGKGRLRSMSSVRSPAAKNQTQESFNLSSSQSPRKNQDAQEEDQKRERENPLRESKGGAAAIADDDYDDYYDEKPAPVTGAGGAKKRVKIGMVKARSLSSLLGLAVAAADDHNK